VKGIYWLGLALLIAGASLFFARESGRIGQLPKYFETHAVATSLMIAGVVSLATVIISEKIRT